VSNDLLFNYIKWKDINPEWKEDTEILDKSMKMNIEICSYYNDKNRIKIEKEIDKGYCELVIEK